MIGSVTPPRQRHEVLGRSSSVAIHDRAAPGELQARPAISADPGSGRSGDRSRRLDPARAEPHQVHAGCDPPAGTVAPIPADGVIADAAQKPYRQILPGEDYNRYWPMWGSDGAIYYVADPVPNDKAVSISCAHSSSVCCGSANMMSRLMLFSALNPEP